SAQVLEQRTVSVVEHRTDQIAVATDGTEWSGAVNVPGNVVENRLKHVERDEPNAPFHQPARQQAALAKTVQAITLPYLFRLLRKFERLAGLGRRHQRISLVERRVHQLRILVGLFKIMNRP